MPRPGDSCVLNVAQTISQGGALIIAAGANFVISGGVVINNNTNSTDGVTICNQTWMKKNLDVSFYKNGDTIPQVTNPSEWANLTTGAWCWYNNDSALYATTYGKLYNWYAVNDPRGLAPAGWHIPSDTEWTILSNCVGGDLIAGSALKESGPGHWGAFNTDANNSSGFTALPGGGCNYSGSFSINSAGFWWSASEHSNTEAMNRMLFGTSPNFLNTYSAKNFGFSVRCLKD